MLVDVVLYKTKLSTTDTMVFDGDTAEEVRANQSAFFATLEKKTFTEKLSFNGRRSLRIKGSYWLLNLDGYNYCTITYSNKTYFCFIDKFTYVNDNCTQVDVTTDYIQTYLTEIKFSQLFIDQRNYSLNGDDISELQYKNYYPISRYANKKSVSLSKTFYSSITGGECKIFFICILINNTTENYEYLKPNYLMIPMPIEKGEGYVTTVSDITCVLLPCYINSFGGIKEFRNFKYANKYHRMSDTGTIIDTLSPAIIDVFFTDAIIDGITVEEDGDGGEYSGETIVFDANKIYLGESIIEGTSGDYATLRFLTQKKQQLALYDDMKSLSRAPYRQIYVGRDGGVISSINPFEIDGKNIEYSISQEVLPTYNTVIKINTKKKYDSIYSISPILGNFIYSLSAWDSYKNTHSASVGDSLATKHAYDMEMAERNYQNQKNIAQTKREIGGTEAGLGGLGNMFSGLATTLMGNPAGVGQFVGGITSTITGGVKTGLTYEQDLENATVAYENSKTTIAQESALLQIGYNDIKNSPSTINNLYSSSTYLYNYSSEIKFNYIEADNMEEVIKYHKRFGFETSLQTDITTINGMHDTNAQHFDYIRTMNASVISENIPKQSADIIAKIFDSGIYLWRNYEKLGEDYFSNYAGE